MILMKEYAEENGKIFDLSNLIVRKIPYEQYEDVHKKSIIACHDIAIEYGGGILLVVRNNVPAKEELWPIGGRIERGVPIKESLKNKVKEECNLEIEDIKFLGVARTYFETDPFGHGKGTDTINIMFFGKGKGELKLDSLHKNPVILKKEEYNEEFRKRIHPYVKEILDKSFPFLNK